MAIQFFLEGVSYRIRKKRLLRKWISHVADKHGIKIEFINFILCSDARLLEINRSYLQHDFYTDVITFPYNQPDEAIQGDIYISIERVREHAQERSLKTAEELHRIMVHGVLHLIGFTDKHPERKKEMTHWEDRHLSELKQLFHVEQ